MNTSLYHILGVIFIFSLFSCKRIQTDINTQQSKNDVVDMKIPFQKVPSFKDKNIAFEPDSLAILFAKNINEYPFLSPIYKENGYKYLWISEDTLQQHNLKSLFSLLEDGPKHGIPNIFPDKEIKNKIERILQIDSTTQIDSIYAILIDIERLSTESSLAYINGMNFGFINPQEAIGKLYALPVVRPDSAYFTQLYRNINLDPIRAMRESQPKVIKYLLLQDELKKWKNLSDSIYPTIPIQKGKIYKLNDTGESIYSITKRLHLLGLLDNDTIEVVNEELLLAVNKLRKRYSISETDNIDQQVIDILNIPISNIIDKTIANLERYRWKFPTQKEDKYIEVNVASQKLIAVEDGNVVLNMNVVVGGKYNKTPLLISKLNYINLNPYWNVPRSIATKEILVKQKKDSTYMQRNNMMLLDSNTEIDPTNVNWEQMNASDFKYAIKQKPGRSNSLGLIKFMFDNNFSVYLHDTPIKSTFGRDNRAASHGCVRLQEPMLLAEFCLGSEPEFVEKLYYTVGLQKPNTSRVNDKELTKLKDILIPDENIGIYLNYYTQYIPEGSNKVYYANDIYDYDKKIVEKLGTLESIK